jgi:hypothetical protein
MQVVPEVESQPDQLEKTEPLAAVAVSEIAVPEGRNSLQVLPQSMPDPETVPDPAPDLLTVNA